MIYSLFNLITSKYKIPLQGEILLYTCLHEKIFLNLIPIKKPWKGEGSNMNFHTNTWFSVSRVRSQAI